MGDHAVALVHRAEFDVPTRGSSIELIIQEPVVTQPEHSSSLRTTEFLLGIRDQAPILLGVAPFGMIFGALAVASGIPPLETQAFSLFIFAGSAQFIAVGLIAEGTGAFIVVLTVFVVNLRHMLYSASMARYFKPLNLRWKFSLSWLLTDEAYAVASTRYRRGPMENAHWYTLGTGLALWGTWQVSTAMGIMLGAGIPNSWNLAFALPLTFLALLAPTLTDRASWAAALTGGILAVLFAAWPFRLGLFIAAIAGIMAGLVVEARQGEPSDDTGGGA